MGFGMARWSQRRAQKRVVHPPGLFRRLAEWIRGREQLLVRPEAGFPLLLVTYPRGKVEVARRLEAAYTHTMPALDKELAGGYLEVLRTLPALVVVLLRPINPCTCLGHFHPPGTESRLTRRLAGDLGSRVAEVDLAYEGIRNWDPTPLSSLAAGDMGGTLAELRFEAAMLAVLLHELHHLAAPDQPERIIRAESNKFYAGLLREFVKRESGNDYGMSGAPREHPSQDH